MYDDFIEKNNLFFSDNYNLTKKFKENINILSNPQAEKYKKNFCWNISLIENFNKTIGINEENNILELNKKAENNSAKEKYDFIRPIINGFVEIRTVKDYDKDFIFCVIARKDNRRTGMRFICRGADLNGNCANFVETETLIFINEIKNKNYLDVISHIQIRGSIPLLWNQPSNFKFVPSVIFLFYFIIRFILKKILKKIKM